MLIRGDKVFWIATERLGMADDAVQIIRGWMESLGPTTVTELSARPALTCEEVEQGWRLLKRRARC